MIAWESSQGGVLDKRDFLISQDYTHSEQNNPSVAVGLNGRFAVIWVDYRNSNGDIFCRLYDSGAVEIGNNFIINDDGRGIWQFDPDLSSDWYGNYYAVWKDYRNGEYPFDPDIYYQRLDSAGFYGANRNITVEWPDSSHQSPAIGSAGWGKSVVAWTDLRNLNWDIFVQSLDADGQPAGSNHKVNDDISTTPQHEPDVALSASGWFVAAWYDGRNGNDDIYLQKFDSAGTPIGGNILINDDGTAAKQKFPSVAIGGNGVIFVVWSDWRNGNYPENSDVYGQRLDSNLNRLGRNVLINFDGNQTSQRDPKVAVDRIGNACVVWADSSSLGWDVKGQMFDHTGQYRDGNFPVNLDSDGKQLRPDVALDGCNLYMVWVDGRSGNYDIYGRLLQYNDPTLIASPARIDLSKDKNDPDFGAIKVVLTNAGYGELEYALESDQTWLTVSKASGSTPDSFYVTINSVGLNYGMHQGRLRLIDIQHDDSTAYLPVLLTLTGPLIEIVPDSLMFKALVEVGSPSNQGIIINNSGSGGLAFSLATTAGWITLNKTAGGDGEAVQAGCDISGLTAGQYEGHVIASDDGALNSPESLKVKLDLQTNMPYLAASPEVVSYSVARGEALSDSLRVVNLGSGEINWQAACFSSWLILGNSSGQDNDIIDYSIATASLDPGTYLDSIVIEDSLAFNSPLIVQCELIVSVNDSIVVLPAQAELGGQFQAPLYLHNHNAINSGFLKFQYDLSMLTVDSIGAPAGANIIENISAGIDTMAGTFTVIIPNNPDKFSIVPGYYHLGDIYGRANDSITGSAIFEAVPEADSFYLEYSDTNRWAPVLSCGPIEISVASAADFSDPLAVPSTLFLNQNAPNPFNGSTTITFGIPRFGAVRLEIYNILGQKIISLIDQYLPAGHYSAVWNGQDSGGREMASGIYFYRLNTMERAAVRKMVYLK